jgi:threonine dehydratase
MGVGCTVVVYEGASETKVEAIERLGANVVRVPYEDWLQIFRSRSHDGMQGLFIHPFDDPAVMAGNGTIGLEILSALPDVDAVVLPFGGGGLCCGVASALRALKPDTRIYACEVETAAPLSASLSAGKPVEIEITHSFVDGIGAPLVFQEMWPLLNRLIDDSLVVGLEAVASAIRLLAERNHIIAEGAGAAGIAAAIAGMAGGGKVVCVISGGNIDPTKLIRILQGEVP